MSTFQKTGTAPTMTFDELGTYARGGSKWRNTASSVEPAPESPLPTIVVPSMEPCDPLWLRDGRQVVMTRDGMTGSAWYLPGVSAEGVVNYADASFPKVNDRWANEINSPFYDLILVQITSAPYAITSSGEDRMLYKCEFSSQPLDPFEGTLGGDLISIRGEQGGFKWKDTHTNVNQTMQMTSLSFKFAVVKRYPAVPLEDIMARLGCVNSDDVFVHGMTFKGTNKGTEPEHAHLLFEGCKVTETTAPDGKAMFKCTFNFSYKATRNLPTKGDETAVFGWNCILRESDSTFQLTEPLLYREAELSPLLKDPD